MDDPAYKQMFSRPRMVRDLLHGFAARGWSGTLDFASLTPVPASFVSDDLRQRHGDLVWRCRFRDDRWLYLVLLLEFQSGVDRAMAVRMLAYTALLYQKLIGEGVLRERDALPPVLPIVIYNGRRRWSAAADVSELIASGGVALARYQPSQRYFLLDESRAGDGGLPRGNLVSALIELETNRERERLPDLLGALIELLREQGDEELTQAFRAWVAQVLLPRRFRGTDSGSLPRLEEVRTMLAEQVREWTEEWVEEGREQGIAQGREQGIAQGREQGIAQGREQGIAQGREQGIAQGRAEERALLCRQAERKFDATTARRLAAALGDAAPSGPPGAGRGLDHRVRDGSRPAGPRPGRQPARATDIDFRVEPATLGFLDRGRGHVGARPAVLQDRRPDRLRARVPRPRRRERQALLPLPPVPRRVLSAAGPRGGHRPLSKIRVVTVDMPVRTGKFLFLFSRGMDATYQDALAAVDGRWTHLYSGRGWKSRMRWLGNRFGPRRLRGALRNCRIPGGHSGILRESRWFYVWKDVMSGECPGHRHGAVSRSSRVRGSAEGRLDGPRATACGLSSRPKPGPTPQGWNRNHDRLGEAAPAAGYHGSPDRRRDAPPDAGAPAHDLSRARVKVQNSRTYSAQADSSEGGAGSRNIRSRHIAASVSMCGWHSLARGRRG